MLAQLPAAVATPMFGRTAVWLIAFCELVSDAMSGRFTLTNELSSIQLLSLYPSRAERLSRGIGGLELVYRRGEKPESIAG